MQLDNDPAAGSAESRWGQTVPTGSVTLWHTDLESAVLSGLISREQAQSLWVRLASHDFAEHRDMLHPVPMPSAERRTPRPWLVAGGTGAAIGAALMFFLL